MPIIVFQHSDAGRPGRLGLTLRDHGHRLDIRRPDLGQAVPADLDDVQGVVVMGGPQNVGDNLAWMDREQEYLREAHERGLPVVGVCLGAQLIAGALGGEVEPMETPVAGFRSLSINVTGQIDTVLSGLAWDSAQFFTHGCRIAKLPAGAVALAGSAHAPVSVFKAGLRTYGFQHHFEADRTMIGELVNESPEHLRAANVSADEIEREGERHYATFARLADRLCVNIASFLIPSTVHSAA